MAAILKNVKCDISATVWPILVKFGTLMHVRRPNLTVDQRLKKIKIQDGGRGHLENRKITISPKLFG